MNVFSQFDEELASLNLTEDLEDETGKEASSIVSKVSQSSTRYQTEEPDLNNNHIVTGWLFNYF